MWTLGRLVALIWCGWLWQALLPIPTLGLLIGGLGLGLVGLWLLQQRWATAWWYSVLALAYDWTLIGMLYHFWRAPLFTAWLFAVPLAYLILKRGTAWGVGATLVAPLALWIADRGKQITAFEGTPELWFGMGQLMAIGFLLVMVARRVPEGPDPETVERLLHVLEQTEAANRQLRSSYRELAHHYRLLQENLETTQDALELLELMRRTDMPHEAYKRLLERLRSRFDAAGCALYLTDASGLRLTVVIGVGVLANLTGGVKPDKPLPTVRQQIRRQVLEHLKRSVEQAGEKLIEGHRLGSGDTPCLLTLPLRTSERMLGVLVLLSREPEGFPVATQRRIESLLPHLVALVRLYDQMQLLSARLQESQLLSEIDNLLFSSALPEEIPQRILQILQPNFQFEHGQVWLMREGTPALAAQWGLALDSMAALRFGAERGFAGWQVQQCPPLLIPDTDEPSAPVESLAVRPLRSLLLVPLPGSTRAMGAILVGHSQPHFFNESHLETLQLLSAHIAIILERAKLLSHLERLATTDGLTGLYNYRYFQERFKEEVQLTQRYQHPLALMLIDLDNFKQINDEYGHLEGDYLLVQVAELLQSTLRGTELMARYGGDEFVVLLPSTNLQGARTAGERLLKAFREARFATTLGQRTLHITCSIGISAYPESTDNPVKLFELADVALEKAKRNGRNQLASFEIPA